MTAPMRSVPAMPPVTRWYIEDVKATPPDPRGCWRDPENAYCEAQAAADRDGQRRRVFKDGDVWRIEVTRKPRRDGFDVTAWTVAR